MISEGLKKIIWRELRLNDYPLEDSTIAETIPGWDSLSHARIVVAIEKEYKVHFSTSEVLRSNNLGDLQALLDFHRRR